MSVITLTRVHLDVLEEHVPELLLNPFQSLLNNFFFKKRYNHNPAEGYVPGEKFEG